MEDIIDFEDEATTELDPPGDLLLRLVDGAPVTAQEVAARAEVAGFRDPMPEVMRLIGSGALLVSTSGGVGWTR